MKTLNKINQFLSIPNHTQTLIVAACLTGLLACTQDKSLDQYRKEKSDNYFAQYNAVVANYTGAVVSRNGKSRLGSMTLQIESGKQVQSSSDGLGSETKAVLTGHLIYNGLVQAMLPINQGVYNPADGSFNAQIPLTDEANAAQSIVIDGKIQSGNFVGSVYMPQYADQGLMLNLMVNNPATGLDAVDAKSLRALQLAQDTGSFSGPFSYIDTSGTSHQSKMKMQVANPAMNPQQQFLRILNPVRIVTVDIRYTTYRSDGSEIGYVPVFTGGAFTLSDADQNHTAQLGGAGQTNGIPLGFSCKQQQVDNSSGALGWNCVLRSGLHSDVNVILSPDGN